MQKQRNSYERCNQKHFQFMVQKRNVSSYYLKYGRSIHGESSSFLLLRMRLVLKLNELMDMSHQSKNLFKIQTFNSDKKSLFVRFKKSH